MPVTGWTLPTRVGWTLMLFGSVLLVFITRNLSRAFVSEVLATVQTRKPE